MNFRQPQKQRNQPSSQIGVSCRSSSSSRRGNNNVYIGTGSGAGGSGAGRNPNIRSNMSSESLVAKNNCNGSVAMASVEQLGGCKTADNSHEPNHCHDNDPPLTMMQTDSQDSKAASDPPIINYDSSGSTSSSSDSETSQRQRRRQLRELTIQSDDCWDTNLSDDEDTTNDTIPLEWNASMVRRQMQMMRRSQQHQQQYEQEQRGECKNVEVSLRTEDEGTANGVEYKTEIQQQPCSNNIEESGEEGGLSLPEQLLQRRLRRKERIQKKHIHTPPPPSSQNKKPSINHLTASAIHSNNTDHLRSSSPLFPDEVEEFDNDDDVDKASTVASSNGTSSIDYSSGRQGQTKKKSSAQNKSINSSPLHSLPQRPIVCSFPDEADRKRIVGCLAAVLASSYPYETAPQLLVKEEKAKKISMPISNTEENDGKTESETQASINIPATGNFTTKTVDGRSPSYNLSSSVHDKWKNIDDPLRRSKATHNKLNTPTSSQHPHLQPHTKQQQLIQQSRESSSRQQQQQQQLQRSTTTTPFDSLRESFRNINRSHSASDLYNNNNANNKKSLPPSTTTSSHSNTNHNKPSFHQSFSFASFKDNNSAARMFDKSAVPASLTNELAEIRHRIRRHAILSELLVSSAEMLMLDPSHAKAFLPMLEGLLTKVEEVPDVVGKMDKSGHNSVGSAAAGDGGGVRQSWKGRGFGGGGMPHHIDTGGEKGASATSLGQSSLCHDSSQKEVVTPVEMANTSTSEEQPSSSEHSKPGSLVVDTKPRIETTSINNEQQRSSSPPSSTIYAPLETAIVEKDLVAPFLQTLTPGAGFRCIALLLLNHLLRDGRGYDARVRQAFKRLAVIVISHEIKVGGILRVDLDEESLEELLWDDGMPSQQQQQQQSNTMEKEEVAFDDVDELARLATRKFEAMEAAIAAKLITLSGNSGSKNESTEVDTESRSSTRSSKKKGSSVAASSPSSSTHGRIALAPKETPLSSQHGISREQLLRGIKVGTAGAVGATLFALTGGLAAPGIAAGLAAVAGSSAIAVGVSTVLSSAAAITTIFGVGGAGLAGYKMHRRTKGLTEFNFHKEAVGDKNTEAELFSTVCISGWLRDARDFQRPWGVSPSHPRIVDKQELLERFYFIHNPGNVFRVPEILKHWKGRYFQLWKALREKYGTDPSNLFPLGEGPRINAELTHEEGEAVDFIIDELGYFPKKKEKKASKKSNFFGGMKSEGNDDDDVVSKRSSPRGKSSPPAEVKRLQSAQQQLKDSSLKPKSWLPEGFSVNSSEIASSLSLFTESETNSAIDNNSTHTAGSLPNNITSNSTTKDDSNKPSVTADLAKNPPPKHLLTVWDYHATYGGELYTVQWESELLMELCDSVTDQMIEWGISATKTILHTTVFATLMTAVTIPYSLVLAANAIDSSWTMAMERADRAGVELAKSLIDSTAGHRPVILCGFSMGARTIYSCLKELAKHQEIWEANQQKKQLPPSSRRKQNNAKGEGISEDDTLKYIREPASIVEDAILMGTPNHVSLKSWEACRRVVAGRLTNVYSRKDLILSVMFQMKRFQGILRPVCGTSPVAINGVENYDVTDLVSAHTDYCLVCGEILKRVRHGEPQRASEPAAQVSAMVTKINIVGNDIGAVASLSDETIPRHTQ